MKTLRRYISIVMMIISLVASLNIFSISPSYAALQGGGNGGGGCTYNSTFFGLPNWYDNLCLEVSGDGKVSSVILKSPNDIWIIVLNVVNILLHLAGLAAVGFVVIGGIRYITSQGESSGISAAKQTIVRALGGLAISIVSAFIVTYVSSIFGQTVHQADCTTDNSKNCNYQVGLVEREWYV